MRSWSDIWNTRKTSEIKGLDFNSTVEFLLQFDGFDSNTGRITPHAWIEFIENTKKKLGIQKTDSIFEVGCGSGAFLFPFYKDGNTIGGIDYSSNLIESCKSIFDGVNFTNQAAIDLEIMPQFDYVVAFSVFFYFPDKKYAKSVLEKMFAKARKGVLLFDLPDLETREACEMARMGTMTKEEYNKKYKGLNHLYFGKHEILEWASELGQTKPIIEDQNIHNYFNNKYRFNCYIAKH